MRLRQIGSRPVIQAAHATDLRRVLIGVGVPAPSGNTAHILNLNARETPDTRHTLHCLDLPMLETAVLQVNDVIFIFVFSH